MHLLTTATLILPAIGLSWAQNRPPRPTNTKNAAVAGSANAWWCGEWAGSPNPTDVPSEQQLPVADDKLRYFVEPQLMDPPFQHVMATEPKVQVPKIWGNIEFRVALMTYTARGRAYSSSKSRWVDVSTALQKLMTTCVERGIGGAFLVPPSPGLKLPNLVVYAYAVGSQFDYTMNYYMSDPYPIDPAFIQPYGAHLSNTSDPLTLPIGPPVTASIPVATTR